MTIIRIPKGGGAHKDIEKNHPDRIMKHEILDPPGRQHAYLTRLYGGPKLDEQVSVAIDAELINGDAYRPFVIGQDVYALGGWTGKLEDFPNVEMIKA